MTGEPTGNGWDEWGKHVLRKLERLGDSYENLQQDVSAIKTEIAMLKVKSTVWGAMAGLLIAIATVLFGLLK